MGSLKYSVIIPVYKNEESIPRLLTALADLDTQLEHSLEVVFVVDGSPDRSFMLLEQRLPELPFSAQLLGHSRNFGSFAAIRSGLSIAKGEFFAVMAADLQEPPELLLSFFASLATDECDVALGNRAAREDPLSSRIPSHVFWSLYRKLVLPEMPPGGVDIFGCNRVFRDQLLRLEESRSSLVALIFWLGFRRKLFEYKRLERQEGVSGWTFKKKVDYMLDSIFAFTDYPVRLLVRLGLTGCIFSVLLALMVMVGHLLGSITVPGYATIIIAVLFFGALNTLGIGIVGTYAWRAYENTKKRPLAIIARHLVSPHASQDQDAK
ncbi:glycosyltransferase family 2 protein [Herbaspirillum frisingense]|uniref:glycosyltransferase family 2 protein n=1 Tax=Herbaspirillum frisingense TaxID=92645 RepID=UPI001F2D406E|nr:glycosyltransferase family 2 protein [Herbaspirillum frisingense]UIN20721.1 glycosyltransferase family 2 protein [Herbaspirillum frisingense]